MTETYFTSYSFISIKGYDVIPANHPVNKEYAGPVIIINTKNRCYICGYNLRIRNSSWSSWV